MQLVGVDNINVYITIRPAIYTGYHKQNSHTSEGFTGKHIVSVSLKNRNFCFKFVTF